MSDTFFIKSPSFPSEEAVASSYKDGEVLTPPLEWDNVPENTDTLALLVDEHYPPLASAPKKTARHWALYNLPGDLRHIPEDVFNKLSKGIIASFSYYEINLTGHPAPATREHRFNYKLYALDDRMPNLKQAMDNKEKLLEAMKGHILGEAEGTGAFKLN